MQIINRAILVLVLSLVCISVFNYNTLLAADAQGEVGLSINPGIIEVVLQKDKVFSRQIEVKNTTNNSFNVQYEVASFVDPGDNSFVVANPGLFNAQDLVQIATKEAHFSKQESKLLSVQFSQNTDFAPGSYFASIKIKPSYTGGGNIALNTQMVVPIFMHIPGKAVREVQITSPNVRYVNILDSLNVALTFRNVHKTTASVYGKLEVYNHSGDLLKKEVLPYTTILPTLTKTINVPTKIQNSGIYKVKATYVVGGQTKQHQFMAYYISLEVVKNTILFLKLLFILILLGLIVRIYKKFFKK